MDIYNSVDLIRALAVALDEGDMMILEQCSSTVAGWMIAEDEKAAYDQMIEAILQQIL